MEEHGKPAEYSLEYRGVEHAQYWQGAGIAFTEWTDCHVGTGSTPHEAAEDALDTAAQVGWDTSDIHPSKADFPDRVPRAIAKQSEDETGELHCYVVLYLK